MTEGGVAQNQRSAYSTSALAPCMKISHLALCVSLHSFFLAVFVHHNTSRCARTVWRYALLYGASLLLEAPLNLFAGKGRNLQETSHLLRPRSRHQSSRHPSWAVETLA